MDLGFTLWKFLPFPLFPLVGIMEMEGTVWKLSGVSDVSYSYSLFADTTLTKPVFLSVCLILVNCVCQKPVNFLGYSTHKMSMGPL